jgi:ferredoxin
MECYIVERDPEKCQEYWFCKSSICPSTECVGCGAYLLACPSEISRPTYSEMVKVHKTLRGTGLRTVICLTERRHIGPEI